MVQDVKKAYSFADASRKIYIELPPEDAEHGRTQSSAIYKPSGVASKIGRNGLPAARGSGGAVSSSGIEQASRHESRLFPAPSGLTNGDAGRGVLVLVPRGKEKPQELEGRA